ncbi:unnamed protein product [Amoebophrya sp. A25]|nr:unnamed protein product [Amoebophrya sp. A25]|eukprot:GSA25T00021343001.1
MRRSVPRSLHHLESWPEFAHHVWATLYRETSNPSSMSSCSCSSSTTSTTPTASTSSSENKKTNANSTSTTARTTTTSFSSGASSAVGAAPAALSEHTTAEFLTLNSEFENSCAFLRSRGGPQLSLSEGNENVWIVKPGNNARGSGIMVLKSLREILYQCKNSSRLVQKYVERPLTLFSGRKFDIRYWVLVRAFDPLEIYLFSQCYLRLCNEPFDLGDLENRQKHISNWEVNKKGRQVQAGAVASLGQFKGELFEMTGNPSYWEEALLPEIRALVITTCKSVQRQVVQRKSSFELFGFDIMVDEKLRPWLLEVNLSPACDARTDFLAEMLKQMADSLLEILLVGETGAIRQSYTGAPRLASAERERPLSASLARTSSRPRSVSPQKQRSSAMSFASGFEHQHLAAQVVDSPRLFTEKVPGKGEFWCIYREEPPLPCKNNSSTTNGLANYNTGAASAFITDSSLILRSRTTSTGGDMNKEMGAKGDLRDEDSTTTTTTATNGGSTTSTSTIHIPPTTLLVPPPSTSSSSSSSTSTSASSASGPSSSSTSFSSNSSSSSTLEVCGKAVVWRKEWRLEQCWLRSQAAVVIQRYALGFLARRRRQLIRRTRAVEILQKLARGFLGRLEAQRLRQEKALREVLLPKMRGFWCMRRLLWRRSSEAACQIQRRWRGVRARHWFHHWRRMVMAVRVQRRFRGHRTRRRLSAVSILVLWWRRKFAVLVKAATRISATWRGFFQKHCVFRRKLLPCYRGGLLLAKRLYFSKLRLQCERAEVGIRVTRVQCAARQWLARRRWAERRQQRQKQKRILLYFSFFTWARDTQSAGELQIRIAAVFRGMRARQRVAKMKRELHVLDTSKIFVASTLAAILRGRRQRVDFLTKRRSVVEIQTRWRGFRGRKRAAAAAEIERRKAQDDALLLAALRIQGLVRGHRARREVAALIAQQRKKTRRETEEEAVVVKVSPHDPSSEASYFSRGSDDVYPPKDDGEAEEDFSKNKENIKINTTPPGQQQRQGEAPSSTSSISTCKSSSASTNPNFICAGSTSVSSPSSKTGSSSNVFHAFSSPSTCTTTSVLMSSSSRSTEVKAPEDVNIIQTVRRVESSGELSTLEEEQLERTKNDASSFVERAERRRQRRKRSEKSLGLKSLSSCSASASGVVVVEQDIITVTGVTSAGARPSPSQELGAKVNEKQELEQFYFQSRAGHHGHEGAEQEANNDQVGKGKTSRKVTRRARRTQLVVLNSSASSSSSSTSSGKKAEREHFKEAEDHSFSSSTTSLSRSCSSTNGAGGGGGGEERSIAEPKLPRFLPQCTTTSTASAGAGAADSSDLINKNSRPTTSTSAQRPISARSKKSRSRAMEVLQMHTKSSKKFLHTRSGSPTAKTSSPADFLFPADNQHPSSRPKSANVMLQQSRTADSSSSHFRPKSAKLEARQPDLLVFPAFTSSASDTGASDTSTRARVDVVQLTAAGRQQNYGSTSVKSSPSWCTRTATPVDHHEGTNLLDGVTQTETPTTTRSAAQTPSSVSKVSTTKSSSSCSKKGNHDVEVVDRPLSCKASVEVDRPLSGKADLTSVPEGEVQSGVSVIDERNSNSKVKEGASTTTTTAKRRVYVPRIKGLREKNVEAQRLYLGLEQCEGPPRESTKLTIEDCTSERGSRSARTLEPKVELEAVKRQKDDEEHRCGTGSSSTSATSSNSTTSANSTSTKTKKNTTSITTTSTSSSSSGTTSAKTNTMQEDRHQPPQRERHGVDQERICDLVLAGEEVASECGVFLEQNTRRCATAMEAKRWSVSVLENCKAEKNDRGSRDHGGVLTTVAVLEDKTSRSTPSVFSPSTSTSMSTSTSAGVVSSLSSSSLNKTKILEKDGTFSRIISTSKKSKNTTSGGRSSRSSDQPAVSCSSSQPRGGESHQPTSTSQKSPRDLLREGLLDLENLLCSMAGTPGNHTPAAAPSSQDHALHPSNHSSTSSKSSYAAAVRDVIKKNRPGRDSAEAQHGFSSNLIETKVAAGGSALRAVHKLRSQKSNNNSRVYRTRDDPSATFIVREDVEK